MERLVSLCLEVAASFAVVGKTYLQVGIPLAKRDLGFAMAMTGIGLLGSELGME